MRTVLFVERDKDIREYVSEFAQDHLAELFQAHAVSSLNEAELILRRETFDGMILDAVHPGLTDLLAFVRDVRHRDFKLPIVALVAYSDMILNQRLKETLRQAGVSIANKIEALKDGNLSRLFQACCDRGFGEEL